MKTLVEVTESPVRPPLALRVAFLVAGAVAVLSAQAPVVALAARVIG